MAVLRSNSGRRDLVDLAVEGEALGTVGGPDGVDYIVKVLVRLLDGVAERGVLVGYYAAADS